MPMPFAYRHATTEWRAFLDDARERLGLVSDNMAYTAIDGVFQVFRRRVSVGDGLAFADLLPAVPHAIFVAGWRPGVPEAWAPRDVLAAEVQAVRRNHNLTPVDAIDHVARTVRGHVRVMDLDRLLGRIGPEAVAYWADTGMPPRSI